MSATPSGTPTTGSGAAGGGGSPTTSIASELNPATWNYERKSKASYFAAAFCFTLGFALIIVQLLMFTRVATRRKESFVVFTDGDPDDLLALHMLYRRSDVEVPLVVVSGNGIAAPRAAFDNVRRFVALCQAQTGAAPVNTRVRTTVIAGAALSQYDRGNLSPASMSSGGSGTADNAQCASRRFARAGAGIRIGADTLYGQAANLKTLTRRLVGRASAGGNASALVDAFASAVLNAYASSSGSVQTTLLVLGPATDAARVLRAFATTSQPCAYIRAVIMAGGRFTSKSSGITTSSSGAADTLMATRDKQSASGATLVGQDSELNFFLDPEAANAIISGAVYSGLARPTTTKKTADGLTVCKTVQVPVVVVPVDVAGSNAAYVDYSDQWSRLTSATAANSGDVVAVFIAAMLKGYAAFEGKTLFPYKGTPKSIAAVAVALDRPVRNGLYTFVADYAAMRAAAAASPSWSSNALPGVVTWSVSGTAVGRSGVFSSNPGSVGSPLSASSSNYAGVVEIALGFASSAASRIFVDAYLACARLAWWTA